MLQYLTGGTWASFEKDSSPMCLDGHQIPVAEGAHDSFNGTKKEWVADFVHGKNGFGDTPCPPVQVPTLPLSSALIVQQHCICEESVDVNAVACRESGTKATPQSSSLKQ